MEGIREYAAALCLAVFFCAILEHTFPQGNLKPVISAILTLYILLTAFRGINADISGLMAQLAQAQTNTVQANDYSDFADSLYRDALNRGKDVQDEP